MRVHQDRLPADVSVRRESTKPRNAKSAGAIAAGVALASGWPEKGSLNGATRSPVRPSEEVSPLQWIGANSEPLLLARADLDPEDAARMLRRHFREFVLGEAERLRVRRMDLDERFRQMRAKPRAFPGARHGVPLVAHAAGIEPEGKCARTALRAARARPAR